jgi:hypothetical protein
LAYIGSTLIPQRIPNPSLIDPRLEVGSGGGLDKFAVPNPDYSLMEPDERRAYLDWHHGGRSDPKFPVRYLFTHLHALERRLVLDRAHGEAREIRVEVERLLSLYHECRHFVQKAEALITLCHHLDPSDLPPEPIPAVPNTHEEMPHRTRLHLGRILRKTGDLEGSDALLWLCSLPEPKLPPIAVRFFFEFQASWLVKFRERFPDGLKIASPATYLLLPYEACNGSFSELVESPVVDISTTRFPADLVQLLQDCVEQIQRLGDVEGRRGARSLSSVLARHEAPVASPDPVSHPLKTIDSLLENRQFAKVELAELIQVFRLDPQPDDLIVKPVIVRQVSVALDEMDTASEPDPRYGSPARLRPKSPIVLFRAPGGGRISEQPEYVIAQAAIVLRSLAASHFPTLQPLAIDVLEERMRPIRLEPVEKLRLQALSQALLGVERVLELTGPWIKRLELQDLLPCFYEAIDVAFADESEVPATEQFLRCTFRSAGLNPANVTDVLARIGRAKTKRGRRKQMVERQPVSDNEPTHQSHKAGDLNAKAFSQEPDNEASAPLPTKKGTGGFEDSPDRAISVQTVTGPRVPARLTPPAEPTGPELAQPTTARFPGLDRRHGSLLRALLDGPLSREAFTTAARELGLSADGALEEFNEWGFETLGRAIVDGQDMLCVPDNLREAVSALEVRR